METKIKAAAPSLPGAAAYNLAAIDYARIVMALLVVSIHVAPLSSFSAFANYGIQNYIARIAVPFFFFCNGFFLFRPNLVGTALRQSVWKQLNKLFWMDVAWTVVYSPILIYNILKRDNSFLKECLSFVRGFVLTGSYTQLWYLPGAILAIFLVWFALDRGISWKGILFTSSALYAVGLCYQSWYGLARRLPVWNITFIYSSVKLFLKAIATTRNGLFFGFLLVALGAYFAQHPLLSARVCRIGFAVSMLIGLAEAVGVVFLKFRHGNGADMYIPAICRCVPVRRTFAAAKRCTS